MGNRQHRGQCLLAVPGTCLETPLASFALTLVPLTDWARGSPTSTSRALSSLEKLFFCSLNCDALGSGTLCLRPAPPLHTLLSWAWFGGLSFVYYSVSLLSICVALHLHYYNITEILVNICVQSSFIL